jgi:hypothetical protein
MKPRYQSRKEKIPGVSTRRALSNKETLEMFG